MTDRTERTESECLNGECVHPEHEHPNLGERTLNDVFEMGRERAYQQLRIKMLYQIKNADMNAYCNWKLHDVFFDLFEKAWES